MSDLLTSEEERRDRIASVAGELQAAPEKRGPGRPKGSTNKPKADDRRGERERFAGAVSAFFGLAGIIGGWFGYEYHEKLTKEEALEGADYLMPLAERFTFLVTIAFWIGLPAWFMLKLSEKFRRKPVAPPRQPITGPAGIPSAVGAMSHPNGSPNASGPTNLGPGERQLAS